MSAYAEETVRRALRAEYAGCTCGRCNEAREVDFIWPEDAEPLDRGTRAEELPSSVLERCYMWCPYVGGLVAKTRPVYTDEDGECPMYEEA